MAAGAALRDDVDGQVKPALAFAKGLQWKEVLLLASDHSEAAGPVTALTAVAIGACEQNWRLGICIFADMAQELKERRSNPEDPDAIDATAGIFACGSAMSCCEKAGEWRVASQLLRQMKADR